MSLKRCMYGHDPQTDAIHKVIAAFNVPTTSNGGRKLVGIHVKWVKYFIIKVLVKNKLFFLSLGSGAKCLDYSCYKFYEKGKTWAENHNTC